MGLLYSVTKKNEAEYEFEQVVSVLEKDLLTLYGPLLQGESLRRAMGYRTLNALRQAILRKTCPVKTFRIKNRRGQYAFTKDVARWLAEQRSITSLENQSEVIDMK